MKTKLMIITDWIGAGTGFSEEMRHVVYRLAQTNEYEIYWVGFNYMGMDMDIPDSCFPDLPHLGATVKSICGTGPNELYGLMGFRRNYSRLNPDMIISLGDPDNFEPFVEERKHGNPFVYMTYTTLDGTPVPPYYKKIFEGVNIPLCMTDWAQREYEKAGIPMSGFIHHGVNWSWYSTNGGEKSSLRRRFGISDDTTLFISWDVNQFRKRLDALLNMWRDFRPESKKAKLFLYTDSDMSSSLGWRLEELIKQYDVPRETILLPENVYGRRKHWIQAEPPEFHRQVSLMGDVYLSASGGEGFGKTLLESLSLSIPVIATDYSAIPEVCGRGSVLIPTYDGPAGRFRIHDRVKLVDLGIVNQEKFVEAMTRLYDNPGEREELGIQGREWARNFDYEAQIVPSWRKLLETFNPDQIFAEELLKGTK